MDYTKVWLTGTQLAALIIRKRENRHMCAWSLKSSRESGGVIYKKCPLTVGCWYRMDSVIWMLDYFGRRRTHKYLVSSDTFIKRFNEHKMIVGVECEQL